MIRIMLAFVVVNRAGMFVCVCVLLLLLVFSRFFGLCHGMCMSE